MLFFMTSERKDILNYELIITGNVAGLTALKSEMLCLSIKQVQQCQLLPVCVGPVSQSKEAVALALLIETEKN